MWRSRRPFDKIIWGEERFFFFWIRICIHRAYKEGNEGAKYGLRIMLRRVWLKKWASAGGLSEGSYRVKWVAVTFCSMYQGVSVSPVGLLPLTRIVRRGFK